MKNFRSYAWSETFLGPPTASVAEILQKEFQLGHKPARFIWDDLLVQKKADGSLGFFRLRYPDADPYLETQLKLEGREARNSQAPLEASTQRLENLFRFVGLRRNPLLSKKTHTLKPRHKAKSLSVIVCFRDRADLSLRAFKSIQKQRFDGHLEIIAINNQSQPQERLKIESFLKSIASPNLRTKLLDYNYPFNHSAQSALGVEHSPAESFLFFNNDAELLEEGTLQNLADWSLEPEIASVGPRILGLHGRLVSAGMAIAKLAQGELVVEESGEVLYSTYLRQTLGNSFACAALSRKAWETLGPLDAKDFPTQYNDVDYCLRAYRHNYRHLYLGTESIFHEPGQSETRSLESIVPQQSLIRQKHPSLKQRTYESPRLEEIHFSPRELQGLSAVLVKGLRLAFNLNKVFT